MSILRGDAEISSSLRVTISLFMGSLMVNDWWDVSLWLGIGGWGGCFGAVIIGCVVYGIQLGWGCVVCGLVCLTFFGFPSGLLWGFFWPQVSILCVCVCVYARALSLAHLVSFCSLEFLFLLCVRAVLLLLYPFYDPVGVVLLSLLCVGSLYSLWSFTRFCAK